MAVVSELVIFIICRAASEAQLITGRNEVVAKVIFLHLFVILFTGGGSGIPACTDPPEQTPPQSGPPQEQTPPGVETPHPLEQTPLGADTPPSRHPPSRHPPSRHPPRADNPPAAETTPPPSRSRLRDTVNERPVRILLECILVFFGNRQ